MTFSLNSVHISANIFSKSGLAVEISSKHTSDYWLPGFFTFRLHFERFW